MASYCRLDVGGMKRNIDPEALQRMKRYVHISTASTINLFKAQTHIST